MRPVLRVKAGSAARPRVSHEVHRREHGSRDRHDGLLWAAAGFQPLKLRLQIGALGANPAPNDLDQQGLEPGCPSAPDGTASNAYEIIQRPLNFDRWHLNEARRAMVEPTMATRHGGGRKGG